ncbi:MAG: peptide ABC transporter substrate-binding protein [Parachlamydiales bacterium]|nr:peptide ABC transporter substrate-binding protein [Parachlamydiales bacterium]
MARKVVVNCKNQPNRLFKIKSAICANPLPQVFQADLTKASKILNKIFGGNKDNSDSPSLMKEVDRALPVVRWTKCHKFPSSFSIYLLCVPAKEEPPLLEMVKKGLGNDKVPFITSFWQTFFYMPDRMQKYYIAEVKVFVEDVLAFDEIKGRLPLLAKEIIACLSYKSSVRQFLEANTLSFGHKMEKVHGELVRLLAKFPRDFDPSLFQELSQFHALAPQEIKEGRPSRHLLRLICSLFFIRKQILRDLALFPQKRHLHMRLIPTILRSPFGTSSIMGMVIGVSLFDKYELLEDGHVLSALQKLVPGAGVVKGSYYQYQPLQEPFRLLYLEIEKKNGGYFSFQETKLLRTTLADELKKRVAQLVPSIFMIRNEEEVLKNILLLSKELRFVHDLPQVMILFDHHQSKEATFTVILVRFIQSGQPSVEEYLKNRKGKIRALCDRIQIVGYLDQIYAKEASVFRVVLPEDPSILRQDSSLNLFLARQKVITFLTDSLGEVRDYNGGMLVKQRERLLQLKELFRLTAAKDPELLEAFFYSITPIEKQSILPLTCLETLFSLFLQTINTVLSKKEDYALKIEKGHHGLFAMIRAMDNSYVNMIEETLEKRGFTLKMLVATSFSQEGSYCRGYFYESFNDSECASFGQALVVGMTRWQEKMAQAQILRLSFLGLPLSIDPRIGGDDYSHLVLRMLYDGLMRLGKDGKPHCAVAKSVEISEDGKQYLFTLRDSVWSNGEKLTAYDFEYSWKTILSADFHTPFAYMFNPIKNAQAVKKGLMPISAAGVHALDADHLQVDLEHPAPYFLELTAHTLYSPINRAIDQVHLHWPMQEGENYVCNGPFILKKQDSKLGFELLKNPNYWEKEAVHLDRICITRNHAKTAKEMFNYDQNDWLGEPLHPWEEIFNEETPKKELLENFPVKGKLSVYWYEFNTKRFPFCNVKLRKAFAIAINRQQILDTLNYSAHPAFTPVPLSHSQFSDVPCIDGDVEYARQLFEEGLKELNLDRRDFPIYTLNFSETRIRREMAYLVVQQWEEAFGVKGRIEGYHWDELYPKNLKGDFQICGVVWSSWINDPIYTLQNFRTGSGGINSTGWNNPQFVELLDAAEQESDPANRIKTYGLAEKILIDEMPVIPLFYEYLHSMHKEHLKEVVGLETGNIDFKWAHISREKRNLDSNTK